MRNGSKIKRAELTERKILLRTKRQKEKKRVKEKE